MISLTDNNGNEYNIYARAIAVAKVSYNQLQWLHHNVAGIEFYRAHKNLQKYYEYVGGILDGLCEYAIGQGYGEPSLEVALDIYKEKSLIDKGVESCYSTAQKLMSDLFEVLNELRNEVQTYFQSIIDEWLYWLFVEGQYKLGQYFKRSTDLL